MSLAPGQPSGPAGANLEMAGRDGFDNGQAGDPSTAGEPARRRPAGVEGTGSEDAGRADASPKCSSSPTGGRLEAEPGREAPATALPASAGRADAPALVFRPAESGAPPPAPGFKAPAAGPARSEAASEAAAPGRHPGEPARKISFQVSAPQSDRRVAVDLVDRGGKLHVAVRTPSEDLAGSLREGLPELVTRLDRSGYGAETWSPGAARGEGRESMAERGSLGGGDPRQDPAPERNPGERERHPSEPAWLDQVRRKRRNSVEESFLWHLQSIR
jgi:hypothetical protein